MAHQHPSDSKRFTLTAFAAFAAVFTFLMLMMNCSGNFTKGNMSVHTESAGTGMEDHQGTFEAIEAAHGEGMEAAEATEGAATEENHSDMHEPAASIKVKLVDGTELDAHKGGIEDKLVTFLSDANSKAGKDVWFDFDNLNFKTGSAQLTEESNAQVKNIAAILKAYPSLKVKIGGYTDKSGDSTANMKLSQSRADAVLAALKAIGANQAQLVGAEGYGSMYAKAAADAPDEERKLDRHISLGIREK